MTDLPIIYKKNGEQNVKLHEKNIFFQNILFTFFKILDRLFKIPQKHIKFY